MLRRLIVAGFAVAIAAPIFSIAPASSAVLFSCSTASGSATLSPGLGHTQTAQTVAVPSATVGPCSNGDTATISIGAGFVSFPPRPLGCPVALGGAGPDYPDQTPELLGPSGSLSISWSGGGTSSGIPKTKAAPATEVGVVRTVLVITSGKYASTPPVKTKLKGKITFTPTGSWECTDNAMPITSVSLGLPSGGSLIMQTH